MNNEYEDAEDVHYRSLCTEYRSLFRYYKSLLEGFKIKNMRTRKT